MKMKKGFTLVELLATITIIGILSILATVGYQSISNRVKKQQYENKVSYIETQAANFASDTGYLNTNVGYLVSLGYVEADNDKDEVINPVDKTSMNCNIITITQEEDTFYGHYEDTTECDTTNIDMVNINLSIIEKEDKENGREIDAGEWTKENVILSVNFVKNDVDKSNITKITWYSNVEKKEINVDNNFDEVNKYSVSAELILNSNYRVEVELSDGTIYQASRAVKIDKQSPLLYSADIKVSSATYYTNESKNVQISSTDQNGSGLAGYYIGTNPECTSNNFYESNKETYNKTFDNGTYYVCSIDNVGNVSDTATFTVEKVDTTSPACNIVVDGTKGENNWYTSDVTFAITGDDTDDGSGVASREISQKKLTSDTTNITVIGRVTDRAGNISVCQASVKRDATKPNCVIDVKGTVGENNWYTSDVTFNNSSSDATSGVASKPISATSLTTDTSSYLVTGSVTDNAGNTASCSLTVKRDATKPNCVIDVKGTVGENNWYTSDVTFNNSSSDATSDVASKPISATSLTVDTSSYSVTGTVTDKAGNTASCSLTVKRDTTPPSCTNSGDASSSSDWIKGSRTISWGCSDATSKCVSEFSGDKKTYGDANTAYTTEKISSYTIKDNAGHKTTCQERTALVYVDNKAPTCKIEAEGRVGDNNWYTGDVTFKNNPSDKESGVDLNNVSINKTSLNYDTSKFTVTGTVTDNAGNTASCSLTVKRDATNPSCTAKKSNTGTANGVNVSYSCSDSVSGVIKCPDNLTGQKSTVAAVRISDNAGNTATCEAVNVEVNRTTSYTKTTKKCVENSSLINTAKPRSCSGSVSAYGYCLVYGTGYSTYSACESSCNGANTVCGMNGSDTKYYCITKTYMCDDTNYGYYSGQSVEEYKCQLWKTTYVLDNDNAKIEYNQSSCESKTFTCDSSHVGDEYVTCTESNSYTYS